jgi:hypothetical protein
LTKLEPIMFVRSQALTKLDLPASIEAEFPDPTIS